jgi:hypothetical protein
MEHRDLPEKRKTEVNWAAEDGGALVINRNQIAMLNY